MSPSARGPARAPVQRDRSRSPGLARSASARSASSAAWRGMPGDVLGGGQRGGRLRGAPTTGRSGQRSSVGGTARRCRRRGPGARSPRRSSTACAPGRGSLSWRLHQRSASATLSYEPTRSRSSVGPPRGGRPGDDLQRRGEHVIDEPVVRGVQFAAPPELVEREAPDRVEQPVAGLGPAGVDADQRGVDQLVEPRRRTDRRSTAARPPAPWRRGTGRRTRRAARAAGRRRRRAGRRTTGWCRTRCGAAGRRGSVGGRARRRCRPGGRRSRRCSSCGPGPRRSRWPAAGRRAGGTARPPRRGRRRRRVAPASRQRSRNSCTDGHAVGSSPAAGTPSGASDTTDSPGQLERRAAGGQDRRLLARAEHLDDRRGGRPRAGARSCRRRAAPAGRSAS